MKEKFLAPLDGFSVTFWIFQLFFSAAITLSLRIVDNIMTSRLSCHFTTIRLLVLSWSKSPYASWLNFTGPRPFSRTASHAPVLNSRNLSNTRGLVYQLSRKSECPLFKYDFVKVITTEVDFSIVHCLNWSCIYMMLSVTSFRRTHVSYNREKPLEPTK